jgi:hypothetical protein
MAEKITEADLRDFSAYLLNCTNAQVQGVFDKERRAQRMRYAALAEVEAARRGITLDRSPIQ